VTGYAIIAALVVLCVKKALSLPREAWNTRYLRGAVEWTALAFKVWWHERRPKL
jgi:hypothetical protein